MYIKHLKKGLSGHKMIKLGFLVELFLIISKTVHPKEQFFLALHSVHLNAGCELSKATLVILVFIFHPQWGYGWV